jgi:hypothetical protein
MTVATPGEARTPTGFGTPVAPARDDLRRSPHTLAPIRSDSRGSDGILSSVCSRKYIDNRLEQDRHYATATEKHTSATDSATSRGHPAGLLT